MACLPMIDEALGGTFVAALLLTGSAAGAEAAVMEGIRVMERNGDEGEMLMQRTMAASIAAKVSRRESAEHRHAESLLPLELRRVLRLSRDFRRCFVLRALAGLSREVCAHLLQIEIHLIDELVCASARALASVPAYLPDDVAARWECAEAAS
ncbi:MAG: hypothetical protein ABJF23_21925, partial [Bryobacteraceae bacterium]